MIISSATIQVVLHHKDAIIVSRWCISVYGNTATTECVVGRKSSQRRTKLNSPITVHGRVGKVFISVIKSVEENINKWLIDPDKQIAKNNLNQLKGLAKEKGLTV